MKSILSHVGFLFKKLSEFFSTGTYGFNPVNKTFATFSNNNRTVSTTSTAQTQTQTLVRFPTNYGKYQFELLVVQRTGTGGVTIAVCPEENANNLLGVEWSYTGLFTYRIGPTSTTVNTSGGVFAFVPGDVLGFCVDTETGDLHAYKNGSLVTTVAKLFFKGAIFHAAPRAYVVASGAGDPSTVTFVDGSLGFNYPVAGYSPITPMQTTVKFDPARMEAGTFTLMDDTVAYHVDGTDNYHTAVTNTGYSTGKHVFYWTPIIGASGTNDKIGVCTSTFDVTHTNGLGSTGAAGADSAGLSRQIGGPGATLSVNSSGTTTTSSITAISIDNGEFEWAFAVDLTVSPAKAYTYRNGILIHSVSLPNGKTWFPAVSIFNRNSPLILNFGQIKPKFPIPGFLNWDENIPVYPAQVESLSHLTICRHTFDGEKGRDKKSTTYDVTASATLDTSIFKFGVSSLAFLSAGVAQYVRNLSSQVFSGTQDFAVEFWVRPSSLSPTPEAVIFQVNSGTAGFRLIWNNQGVFTLRPNGTTFTAISSGSAILADTWYFVQIVRESNVIKLHINGVNQGSSTYTENITGTGFYLGSDTALTAGTAFKGHFDDFRLTRGAARPAIFPTEALPVYFTDPQEQVVNDPYWANVSALLHFNNINGSTTITDQVAGNVWTANNGAAISTTQSKFGGSSVLFDGVNDYLSIPDSSKFKFGTGDFTIEAWVYLTTTPGVNSSTIFARNSLSGERDYSLGINSQNKVFFYMHSIANVAVITTEFVFNIPGWHHVALVRQGTTFKIYFDGVEKGVGTSSGSTENGSFTGPYTIGSDQTGNDLPLGGYIDELRITKGVARYTANFTPPTAEFPNQGALVSARYWRIYITANNGDASYTSFNEWELRETSGGPDLTNTVQPSFGQSSYFTGTEQQTAAYLTDNDAHTDPNDAWVTVSGGAVPSWAYVGLKDAGGVLTAYTVREITIWPQAGGLVSRAPKDFIIQASDDATNWVNVKSFTNVTDWVSGTSKVFTIQ